MRRFTLLALSAVLMAASAQAQPHDPSPIEFHLAPMAGYGLFDNSLQLEDGLLLEGKAGITLLRYLGFEGSFGKFPVDSERNPNRDFPLDHIGADVLINLLPDRVINPYILGGWTQLDLHEPAGAVINLNGWEYGAGFKIKLATTANSRIDLRLDARDVFAKNDGPLAEAGDTQHHYLFSGGIQVNLFGPYADADGDGIPDYRDHCPETRSGAKVDRLGCEPDTDGDGVGDGLDRCADTPLGAIVDNRGCPTDSDEDGVLDGIDRCPGTPKGASVGADGCPTDSDNDGVPNGVDACPDTPAGVRVDSRGCPVDSDGDGVPDGIDRCEGTPAGVEVDAFGCPIPTSALETELVETGKIELQNVYFDSGKATLKQRSHSVLEEVGEILIKRPHLLLEIGGHTDSQGSDAFNQSLSEARANSVLDFVLENFPELRPERFTVKGYGEGQPVDTNETSAGRARNRRVEFMVLQK